MIDSGRQQTDPRRPAGDHADLTSSGIAANVPACITWPPGQIAASGEGTQNLPGCRELEASVLAAFPSALHGQGELHRTGSSVRYPDTPYVR